MPDQMQQLSPGHRLAGTRSSKFTERQALPGRSEQAWPESQRIREPSPLRRQRVQCRGDMLTPPSHHHITPATSQRNLGRRSERLPISVPDQPFGADVDQPDPGTCHREEIRSMAPPRVPGAEPQHQRLRHHIDQARGEVQRKQQTGLFQALRTMVTASADQELKPRAMTLTSPPGEPADRLPAHHRHLDKVLHRAGDLLPAGPPRHRPPPRPSLAKVQTRPPRVHRHGDEKLFPATPVRPQRILGNGAVRLPQCDSPQR